MTMRPNPRHNLNYAFEAMDVDRSGTISHDEFRQVSAPQGQGRTVLRRFN